MDPIIENVTLRSIASRLTQEWKDVGRNLNLLEEDLYHVQTDNSGNIEETIYKMLLTWKLKRGSEATKGEMFEALKKSGRIDLAERYSSCFGLPISKEDLLVETLKKKYTSLCSLMRPVPWKRDMKWTIKDIFVKIGVSRLDQTKDSSNKDSWKLLKSYTELFTNPELADAKRITIEGGPGCGKTTLMYQLAYLWSEKIPPMDNIDIFILLFLRQLKVKMSIFEAIRKFLLPKDSPLTESDIKCILKSKSSVVFALDGLDEYAFKNDSESESSDVMVSFKGEMLTDVKEIISTRLSCLPDVTDCCFERLQLQRFDREHWKEYIRRIYTEDRTCDLVLKTITENEIFCTLCEIPLFFTLLATLIGENLAKHKTVHFQSTTEVFRYIIMCMKSHFVNKKREDSGQTGSNKSLEVIEEMAFTGLLRNAKCASWSKGSLQSSPNYTLLVDSGILVEEECEVDFNISFLEADLSPMAVRFVHKLFQEWFGACHLCRLSKLDEDWLILLTKIDQDELHYLLRFTCGLNQQSVKAILQHLLTVKSFDVFDLCFTEYQGDIDLIREEIEKRCGESLVFPYKQIQFHRPRVSMLSYASKEKISVKRVDFGHLAPHDDNFMTTTAGVLIKPPLTVQYITILRGKHLELLPWLNWMKECKGLKKLEFETEEEDIDSHAVWEAFRGMNVKVKMIISGRPAGYVKNKVLGLRAGEWKDAHPYKCNGCGDEDIFGSRFRCTTCLMWNLCESCKEEGIHPEHQFTEFNGNEKKHEGTEFTISETFGKIDAHDFQLLQLPRLCALCRNQPSHQVLKFTGNICYEMDYSGCDSCGEKHIIGNRYICLTCKYFNLCEVCHDRGVHKQHEFGRIEAEGDFWVDCENCGERKRRICFRCNDCIRLEQSNSCKYCRSMTVKTAKSLFRNGGIELAKFAMLTCGCFDGSRDTKKLRYKCRTCVHLSFCDYCKKLKVNNDKVEHHNAMCDGCGTFPIKGTRFKCASCEDYDLCECCRNQNIHTEHNFLVILEEMVYENVDNAFEGQCGTQQE